MVKQGFTFPNIVTLGLLTLSFIIGEISHFLLGVVSKEMAQDIGFGKMKCYNLEDSDYANNDTLTLDCLDIEERST